MFDYTLPVLVLTVGACGVWGYALWWSLKQPKHRWYHVWLLSLSTLFWFLGESVAIRLGKYRYEKFPLTLHLPGAGTPSQPGFFEEKLRAFFFSVLKEGPPSDTNPSCVAKTWDIPFPVIALEAALLFGLFRLSVGLLRSDWKNWRGRLRVAGAAAGLSALLLVNVTAVLDPVVSTTKWCETLLPDPNFHHLSFGLWEWFTTEPHKGFWFGVPLVNYAAWFLSAATFSFFARLDDQRAESRAKRHTTFIAYVAATVGMLILLFVALIPVKIAFDLIMVHGQRYLRSGPFVSDEAWQFGTVVALFGLGAIALARGRRHHAPVIEWISVLPKVIVFTFCLGLLLIQLDIGILIVWAITVAIEVSILLWLAFARRVDRQGPPSSTRIPGSGVGV